MAWKINTLPPTAEVSITMQTPAIQFLIVLLALGGLVLCIYINSTKRKGKPLVCPFDGACDFVVRSEYSIVFGINAEVLGMLYYTTIGLLFSVIAILELPLQTYVILASAALSAAGFLMSLYFMWLQFFVMKKWCTLCAGSALISTAIFVLSLYGFWPTVAAFLGL